MSTLVIRSHREELDAILTPASPDGDNFTAPPGSVVLFVVNRLKRSRGFALRVERHGGVDDVSQSVGPRESFLAGPFGMAYGADGFEIPGAEPVTVKITYPHAAGLQVCAVRLPEVGDVMTYDSPGVGLQPRE